MNHGLRPLAARSALPMPETAVTPVHAGRTFLSLAPPAPSRSDRGAARQAWRHHPHCRSLRTEDRSPFEQAQLHGLGHRCARRQCRPAEPVRALGTHMPQLSMPGYLAIGAAEWRLGACAAGMTPKRGIAPTPEYESPAIIVGHRGTLGRLRWHSDFNYSSC